MAIAIFTTWTTYGSWLPGDARGWYSQRRGLKDPDEGLEEFAGSLMNEQPILLDPTQRKIVDTVVADHCTIRRWELHTVNCRSNHVHVVVTANDGPLNRPREQFKTWATRRLKETDPNRMSWWTRRGWDVWIDNEEQLAAVVRYVNEGQDFEG
jgi:REP element-mobilizing transposase RayT